MTRRLADLLCVICITVLGLFVIAVSRHYPTYDWKDGGSPGFILLLLSLVLIVLSGAMLVEAFRSKSTAESTNNVDRREMSVNIVAVLVILLVFSFIMEWLGFLLSTFLFLVISVIVLDRARLTLGGCVRSLVLSAFVVSLIYLVFQQMAKVPLPRGIIEF